MNETQFTSDLKKRWLDALRSGKYEQGDNFLRRRVGGRTKYCCLGVLAEVHQGKGIWEVPGGPTWVYGSDLIGGYTVNILVGMNDLDDNTFDEIADWIEENIPAVDE